jgi:hypothetical protein
MRGTQPIFAALLLLALVFAACGSRTGLLIYGGNVGGAGGEGGLPATGWEVDVFRQRAVTKVDLLLTLDNSISMADKQAILAEAVPLLVQRLISAGSVLEPVSDVHVGVITSSLGSHGAAGAKDVCVAAQDDDHAHLLGQLRGLPGTWRNEGFLAWDPHREQKPPGDADAGVFSDKLRTQVQAAGEHGCGYEATLEAWYRFLIEPDPPASVVVRDGSASPQGIDQAILEQRAGFLRPDSLVAIIMLSDENDCSLRDDGVAWLVSRSAPMPRSTSSCAKSPNDACCQSCASTPTPGCADPAKDVECAKGALHFDEDDLNLRCWQQKRRFGMDFMYPTTRYSGALSASVITSSATGMPSPNPLFTAPAGALARDRSLVYLAGIVGVPWQDIADDDSLTGPGLHYLTASELTERARWDVIVGDPGASPSVAPTDPFMLETPEDRTGLAVPQQNPIAPDVKLVSASSSDPRANVINGHEQLNVGQRDLQYACTFPLDIPRNCDQSVADADRGCDCFEEDRRFNRPICQPPGGGPAGIVQRYAKAFPGLRHLQVLKEVGDSGIVASICPKVLDKESADYGYNPAVEALNSRIADSVFRRCLRRALPFDEAGRVPCEVVQAFPKPVAGGCACDDLGMTALDDPGLSRAVQGRLQQLGQCGSNDPTCEGLCRCALPQLAGSQLTACQNDASELSSVGFCYLDDERGEPNIGRPALLADCPQGEHRDLRLLGGAPSEQTISLLACPTTQ